jgi:hypothetical protein
MDDPLQATLGPLVGVQIPGGCDLCDAYQVVEKVESLWWHVHVYHDDWCPWWLAHQAD